MKRANGYLTVYMALSLTVLLSLFLTLIDGARRNGGAMEAACTADIGLQSILAEYHRELMEQYNLFAVDSSYGTGSPGMRNTEAHLLHYLEKNLSLDGIFLSSFLYRDFLGLQADGVCMTGVSVLSDDNGAVFRRRCAEAVSDDLGLSMLSELRNWMDVIQVNGLDTADLQAEKEDLDRQIQDYAYEDEAGVQHVGVDNPTKVLEERRRLGILKMTVGDEENLSQNTIDLSGLIGNRMAQGNLNRGNLSLPESEWPEELAERFFFQEYLLRYMGHFGKTDEKNALNYQIEYLIAGKENDVENLRSVADRICAVREAANAMHIWSDSEKSQEVSALAEAVCTLLMVPELAPVLEAALVLGWAYAESVYDVKTLLAGGKVPLIKDKESWHYGLESALTGSLEDRGSAGSGLSYEDYLRIFMAFTNLDRLTARAMDMVEADIRMTEGNYGFRLDGCYDCMQFDIRIGSRFGYRYQISRDIGY